MTNLLKSNPWNDPSTRLRMRRALRAGLVGGLAALSFVSASEAAPASEASVVPVLAAPSGPFPVGTASARVVDRSHADALRPARGYRELMVSAWYPRQGGGGLRGAPLMPPREAASLAHRTAGDVGLSAGAVRWGAIKTHARTGAPVAVHAGGWPVLLYSPGLDGPRSLGTELVEDLASRGYVVVTIDHTYQPDQVEFPGGRVEHGRLPEPANEAQFERLLATLLRARLQDFRFVLATLNGDAPWPKRWPTGLREQLDTTRVGAFGHSFGGAAFTQFAHDEPQVRAVANLDGALVGPVIGTGIDQPYLLLSSGPGKRSSVLGWAEFWAHTSGPKTQVRLRAAQHLSFMDLQTLLPQVPRRSLSVPLKTLIGTIDPTASLTAQRNFLAAFFDQQLLGRSSPLLTGSASLPGAAIVP